MRDRDSRHCLVPAKPRGEIFRRFRAAFIVTVLGYAALGGSALAVKEVVPTVFGKTEAETTVEEDTSTLQLDCKGPYKVIETNGSTWAGLNEMINPVVHPIQGTDYRVINADDMIDYLSRSINVTSANIPDGITMRLPDAKNCDYIEVAAQSTS